MTKRFSVEPCEARRLFAAAAVDAIANYTAPVGKTIQIPVTSTSNAGAVTYSVRDSSNNIVEGFRIRSNTFIQMDVAGFSQPMVFELFDDTSPDTVRRIKGLINAKFYDGLTFHRILNNFVIQGGDPKGDGSGGPQFTFDDEFNKDTIFSGTGQLAMANSGKDTNGSQFFITEGPQRALDYNHTIFGQLVRGEATRQAISNVSADGNGTPASSVVITRVRIIQNSTDAVLVVKPSVAGTYNVKVTGTNADGSSSRSFTVTATADATDEPPIFVNPAPVYYTTAGKPVSINLSSIDPEGTSANFFGGQYINANGSTGKFSGNNQNVVTLTPAAKNGPITLKLGVVSSSTAQNRGSTSIPSNGDAFAIYDSQKVIIAVGDLPISATANNFDATAGVAQRFLVGTIRDTDAAGSPKSFSGTVDWGDGTVSSGTGLTINKASAGRYNVFATHTYSTKTSGAMPITLTVNGDLGAYAQATSVATVRTSAEVIAGTLSINGTSGDDKIGVSRKGSNYLVTVNGKTTSFATSGISLIQALGLAGSDVIQLADTVLSTTYLDGGDGNDAIFGGAGNDVINAGAGADTVFTGAGSNKVAGGEGNDTVTGGIGRDRITGGIGNDSLVGAAGRDILSGDEGNDIVVGGASNDSIYGGTGDDILNGLSGADLVDGGAGRDTAKNDVLDTRTGVEVLV